MSAYVVSATSLNLRRAPAIDATNVIAVLPHGQSVEALDQSNATFWQVQTSLRGQALRGYAAARYLTPQGTLPEPEPARAVTELHFPRNPGARLDSLGFRHCPLAGDLVTRRDAGATSAFKVSALHAIARTLDVERSERYQPTTTATYCNIYAYDFCYFAAAYLPRVWWTAKALLGLARGEPQPVSYATTVRELNANGLYDWLSDFGDDFGWQPTFDLDELQSRANRGGVGIISAQRQNLNRSGHIVCVLPEAEGHGAERTGGRVIAPLQSQAGATNKRYFASDWWVQRASEYRAVGFWYHA
jgi:hypothetical protein